jgi:ankyrin repeat protein
MHRCAQSGDVSSARALLECGGDVNATTKYMDTPLHRASLHGHIPFVEFLLEHGAKIDTTDIVRVHMNASYILHLT